jgi:BASS family bile acid:Na+ symporter
VILSWLVPACVFVMMTCIGLDVATVRFAKLLRTPRPLLLGLAGQFLVGPLCGLVVAYLFRDNADIALGLVLLVASPGGPVSNALVFLFRGLPEVSVVLTAINGVLSLITTPLIVNAGFSILAHQSVEMRLPVWSTMLHILWMVVVPIVLGLLVRNRCNLPASVSAWARRISLLMLMSILLILISTTHERILGSLHATLPAVFLICLLILLVTAQVVRCAGMNRDMRFTIATEVSIHNVPVALLMSEVILMQPRLSGVILVYVPVITLMVSAWGVWRLYQLRKSGDAV